MDSQTHPLSEKQRTGVKEVRGKGLDPYAHSSASLRAAGPKQLKQPPRGHVWTELSKDHKLPWRGRLQTQAT